MLKHMIAVQQRTLWPFCMHACLAPPLLCLHNFNDDLEYARVTMLPSCELDIEAIAL